MITTSLLLTVLFFGGWHFPFIAEVDSYLVLKLAVIALKAGDPSPGRTCETRPPLLVAETVLSAGTMTLPPLLKECFEYALGPPTCQVIV